MRRVKIKESMRGEQWPNQPSALKALAVLLAGLAITTAMVAYQHANWRDFRTARFQEAVEKATKQIEGRILSYEHGLRGTRSAMLAAGPEQMTLAQFRLVNRSRDPLVEFPGSRGFGFIQRVPAGDESAFLRTAKRLGRADFTIRQLAENPGERYVIKYIEPEAINRAAVGLDIGSEENRREAMRTAMKTGLATLTRPIDLVQANANMGKGFLLLLPVYPDYPVATEAAARERSAIGATYTPLLIGDVLQDISPLNDGINLVLSDKAGSEKTVFFGREDADKTRAELKLDREFQVFGRTWLAEYQATPVYLQKLPANQSFQLFLTGAFISLLLSLLAYRELQSRDRQMLAKQRLEAFIENAPTALAMLDRERKFLVTSPQWLVENGIPAQEITGLPFDELLPELADNLRHDLEGEAVDIQVSKEDQLLESADGRKRWAHIAVQAWHNAAGKFGGYIIFTEDVSERHQIMASLAAAKAAAEQANRAKSIFLGNMSHEMRTPVHQLYGLVTLAEREAMSDKQARRIEMMKISIQRLDTVISGILTLVDLEARTTQVEIRAFDLAQLCRSTVDMLEERATPKNLQLATAFAPLPGALCGDQAHIRTILSSYINNAITFSDHGTILVKIDCVDEQNSSVTVRISVSDQGIGISPEKLKLIFDEFEQADNSHTRRYGGTGIGLAIVKKLANLMGGDAGCESQVGQGSTFWVTLNLLKSEALLKAPPAADDYSI